MRLDPMRMAVAALALRPYVALVLPGPATGSRSTR